jgi:hypothetical protein
VTSQLCDQWSAVGQHAFVQSATKHQHLNKNDPVQAAGPLVPELEREDRKVAAYLAAAPPELVAAKREVEAAVAILDGPLTAEFDPDWRTS